MGVFATNVEDAVVAFFNPELVESSGGSQTAGAWPLVSLPQAASVALVYLGLVAVGSRVMACRPAMCGAGIKRMMVVYNAVQVFLCLYMAGETVRQYWILGYRPLCNNPLVQVAGQPFDPTGMSDVLWVFYLSKVLDFCDTAFIVLRKKDRQLSFLHVFHHTSIFLVYWLITTVAYNGDGYLAIVLNSVVHFVMYSYYLIVAVSSYTPPWKRWVTRLQMGQFVTMISQGLYLFFVCPTPGYRVTILYVGYICFLLALFSDFSARTYKPGTITRKKE